MRNKIGHPQYLFSFTMAPKSHTGVSHMITTLFRRILKESALAGFKNMSETIRKMVRKASESPKHNSKTTKDRLKMKKRRLLDRSV